MKKLFKSKVAFIAFVILFTTFVLTIYKDPFARIAWSLSMGGLTGFVFAQWYWKDKMDKIKDQLDARMASPEQTELLKRKENELFEAANRNLQLVNRIGELQNENEHIASLYLETQKHPAAQKKIVRAKLKCATIEDSPECESVNISFYPVTSGSEENKSFSKNTPSGQLILGVSYDTPAHKFFKENVEYYLDLSEPLTDK